MSVEETHSIFSGFTQCAEGSQFIYFDWDHYFVANDVLRWSIVRWPQIHEQQKTQRIADANEDEDNTRYRSLTIHHNQAKDKYEVFVNADYSNRPLLHSLQPSTIYSPISQSSQRVHCFIAVRLNKRCKTRASARRRRQLSTSITKYSTLYWYRKAQHLSK